MKIRNNIFLGFGLLSLIFIDQAIKWWMMRYHPSLVLINRGVIFGWIQNEVIGYALLVIGFGILAWLILKHRLSSIIYHLSLVLIIAGALSNLIDRLARGYIIDYIHFFNLNVFNLADVFIMAGILFYAFTILRKK